GINPLFDQIHCADALLDPYRTGANRTEKLNKDSVTGEKQQMVVSIDGFSTQHPLVLSDLQRSMARILEIAKTLDHHQEVSTKPPDVADGKKRRISVPDVASIEPSSSRSNNRQSGPCQQLMRNLNSFASKLVEATLSRAYFVLFHSGSAPSEDVHRTFGSTLRTRTREQILLDLRWFLGPGKKALPHASGYLWKHTSQNDAPLRWASYSPLDDVCFEVDYDADIDHQPSVRQPKLLTVLGVLQELAHLGARVIDNDTLEIILDEQRSLDPMKARNTCTVESGIEDQTVPMPNNNCFSEASKELLKLKLSVPQLTVNLALAGTCAKTGPVYSSNEVAKAVEAAIIMVTSG
ncbi:hypothetical protein N5P37_009973, partial [Trichoderma harzianum]